MKTTVTSYDFLDAFRKRRPNSFSKNGLLALFEYLEQLEQDCGTEIELDVIAICCDYSEHSSAKAACDDIGLEIDTEGKDKEEIEKEALSELNNNTTVIGFDGGVIVQNG